MEKCPKCESKEFSIKYHKDGEQVYFSDVSKVNNRKRFMRNDNYYSKDEVDIEHLVHSCKTCGYKVASETKDSDK